MEKERRGRQRCMYSYYVYRFCCCCFFRSNLLLETSSNNNGSSHGMERKRRQMCLHCDEDDGGDRFLMALTGTSLYYRKREREKRIVPYLGRQSLRRCKIDWLENISKDAYLTSNYLLIIFSFYFWLLI